MQRFYRLILALALLALALPAISVPAAPAIAFADPAFERVWTRSDKPVSDGRVARTYFWGPGPNSAGLQEDYAESPGGHRLVQYFDKSRMEINDQTADKNSPFYVTNGLLTVELISGRMALGATKTAMRPPANLNMSGDPGDSLAPTYAAFAGVSNTPLGDHKQPNATGQTITASINHTGTVKTTGTWPAVKLVYFEAITGHNIAGPFWDFLNSRGPVITNGSLVTETLTQPWFYASGLPISDPYWAQQTVAGKVRTVLIQAFERRVLTYTPDNPPAYQVEMGNIGQHYYNWRYSGVTPGPQGTPIPAAGDGGTVQITGVVTKSLTLTAADLGTRKTQTISASFTRNGAKETHSYTGVLLYDLLIEAGGGGNLGKDLPGRYILASGTGGRVAISWGEIDFHFTQTPILVATARDGAALDSLQLVVPSDKTPVRYVSGLQKLEVFAETLKKPATGALKLLGVPKALTLTGSDLAARQQATATVVYTAGNTLQHDTFKGVPLTSLLADAGLATGNADLLSRVVIARGDERHAAIAWGEFDPAAAGVPILVAIQQGGAPICCGAGGSPRLVIPGDHRGGRFVPHLTQIEVLSP